MDVTEVDVVDFFCSIWPLWVPADPVRVELVGKAWRSQANATLSWSGPSKCWVIQARQGRGALALFTSLMHELGHVVTGSAPDKTAGDYSAEVRAAMQAGERPAVWTPPDGEIELKADSFAAELVRQYYGILRDWRDPQTAAEVTRMVVMFNRKGERR